MIKPDQAPDQDESVGAHSPVKTEREQDLVFLQRCFKDSMTGEIENWSHETSRQYFATLSRLVDLLGLHGPTSDAKLSYGERLAATAIVELSRKISASGKARNLMHQITGRKH